MEKYIIQIHLQMLSAFSIDVVVVQMVSVSLSLILGGVTFLPCHLRLYYALT